MADRSIVLRLRAEVEGFRRGMREAANAADASASSIDRNGDQITTAGERMVRSAEVNREAWTSTGQALGIVAAAVGAVGIAVFKTGTEYNMLQQTSRAALRTLLGGAEAANAQMDKLDEFARTSPFAKQVFIEAQQQLLGFGFAAEDVVPTLDAIQNATAAIGGSNTEIAQITTVLAKIQSQGKITARELMQLGIHGIDAATLIGSRMDMTAEQIRSSITAGALDAETALTALTDGMQERFGGAAENVKETYAGAIDRVKAAWRDLAADLMEPLVGPDGGGMLVDLANNLADLMRSFEALPGPVKNTVVALTGVTGAAAAAGAAFLLLFPRVMDTITGVQTLARDFPRAASALGRVGRTAGIAAVGLVAMVGAAKGIRALSDAIRDVDRTSVGLEELSNRLLEVSDAGDIYSNTVGDMVEAGVAAEWAFSNMADAVEQVVNMDWASSTFGRMGLDASGIYDMSKRFEDLGTTLSNIADTDLPHAQRQFRAMWQEAGGTAEAGQDLLEIMPAYRETLYATASAAGLSATESDILALALGDLELEVGSAAEATDDLTGATEALATQTGLTQEELEGWRETASNASAAFIDIQSAYDDAIQSNMDLAQSTADATGDAEASWEDFYDGVSVSAEQYIEQLAEQVAAQENWQDNMLAITKRANEGMSDEMRDAANNMIDELMELGPAGAEQVALLESMTDDEFEQVVALWSRKGTEAVTEFTDKVEGYRHPEIEVDVDTSGADTRLRRFIRDASNRVIRLETHLANTGHPAYRAHGGPVYGPGTTTSDSIPAMLSNREFVHTAAAHEFWGTQTMTAVNNRDVMGVLSALSAKGFAAGGSPHPAPIAPSMPSMSVSASLGDVVARIDPGDIATLAAAVHAHSAEVTNSALDRQSQLTQTLGRMA